ncbi:MAG: efflux RND transporter periplasmic adaptor subunit [Rubripirellula sp.]
MRSVLGLLFAAIISPSLVEGQEGNLTVDEMVVVVIDAVNVPAPLAGTIADVSVREGSSVVVGQELARLDDRQAKVEEALAETQLGIAERKTQEDLGTDLANKKLAQQKQVAKQHEVVRDIASRKAANEVRTLASKKSSAVAKNELDRATHAREQFVDSVSQSEIDGLRLAYEKSKLETQQAEFDRQIDALQAKAEQQAAQTHVLSIERTQIEVGQAIAEQRVQTMQIELERQQVSLAKIATERHRLTAPINGVVVERMRGKGEWVNAGDPVLRVIRLDRLRAEGFVPADAIESLRGNRTVSLEIQVTPDRMLKREGRIVFISPEIDPVNDEVRFWVEFDNTDLDVLPGMRLRLSTKP